MPMKPDRPHISVVIPCYRCAECLEELYRQLKAALEPISPVFEIVMVNDASPSYDWDVIQKLTEADLRVKGVNLSRNFGQHHAITAGIDFATGDWVIVMDGDLQDQPHEIPKLYAKAREGYDVVFARRVERKDTFLKVFMSRSFSLVYNFLSNVRIDPTIGNFSISARKVMDNFRRVRESSRAFGLTLLWCGFKTAYVDVDHGPRYAGKTSYNLRRSIHLAIESISSQSNKPLRISINAGFFMSALSFLIALVIVLRKLIWGIPVSGWASTIVSLYFIGGLLMANLGIIGLYLGKVFDETKGRPIYIVRDVLNIEESD